MSALLVFILLAMSIGICLEQMWRIQDDYVLQRQIDELRERMEKMEDKNGQVCKP